MNTYWNFLFSNKAILGFSFIAIFWGNFGQSFFVGSFGEGIQESLSLSSGDYGLIYSIATLASAVMVAWFGGAIDRLPLKRFTLIIALGLFFATVILSQAQNMASLLLGFFLLRLFGQALLPHAGVTMAAKSFDADRGKAISIVSSGVPVGEMILPKLAVFLILMFDWRTVFIFVGLSIPLIFMPLAFRLIRKGFPEAEIKQSVNDKVGGSTQNTSQPNVKSAGRRAVLSDYRYWLVLPGIMAGPFVVTGIFIQQPFIIKSMNWTPEWFATCFIVYGGFHWASSLVSGLLVDRFKSVNLLPFFSLPMALALFIVGNYQGQWVALVMMSLLAVSIGSSPPITGSLWPEIYGTKNLGAIRSMNIALMVFATALSPTLFGKLFDNNVSLAATMNFCGFYVIVGSILMFFSYTINPKRHSHAAS
ncbi:MFS transporter [Aurantivibrio infirmus]